MSKLNIYQRLSFIFCALSCILTAQAQTYVPVKVSGFNHDIIAEGSGGMNRAAATTTTTFDDVNDSGDNVMYAKDFRGNKNMASPPPFGLPNDGVIKSKNLIGATYQLAPYAQNNALVLKTQNDFGVLTLETPGVFSKIAFLAASANGSSSFDMKLKFSDGDSTTYMFTVRDWFDGNPFAIDSIGRIHRTDFGTHLADNFSHSGNNPRLYDDQLIIPAPYNSKILTSITIKKSFPSGRTAIFAIIGITPINAPSAPIATAATSVAFPSFTANWQASSGATSYILDVSSSPTFSTLLPNFNNRNVGNVLTFNITGLVSSQPYYYRVRASNVSGTSPSSNTITVPFPECPIGDYLVSSQGRVDSFKIVYPNCKQISGNLNVTDNSSVTNLDGFSNLEVVTGQINIVRNAALSNLDGFQNLKSVGGNLWISDNTLLSKINNFNKLTSCGVTIHRGS